MTVADIITIIIAGAGVVSALSFFYGKFIAPVKKVIKQVEQNAESVIELEAKIAKLKVERSEDNTFGSEVRSLLLESLIAILETLEKSGANGTVTAAKKKIIAFLSKQL